MQLMSWMLGRLGSRFSLFFEPHHRRVMHSALGRLLDRPLDLAVGLIEPNGTERVLPLSREGAGFTDVEQFERMNSITFRGHASHLGLRFEFNVHAVFYPGEEGLCAMPAFYLECRVNPSPRAVDVPRGGTRPERVRLVLRVGRPETRITTSGASRIELAYRAPLEAEGLDGQRVGLERDVEVVERIQSLNEGCEATREGRGLTLELPVTEVGSGMKWRLVWGAYCGEPVTEVEVDGRTRQGWFHYTDWWADLDEVMEEAIRSRDYRLSLSRRFEKLMDETSLDPAERHLLHQGFQAQLASGWWLNLEGGDQWYSAWEGRRLRQAPIEAAYNASLFYLSLWPDLLAKQLRQWARFACDHPASGGCRLPGDGGLGTRIGPGEVGAGGAAGQPRPARRVKVACDYLLMLQAYTRLTGDLAVAGQVAETVAGLGRYLAWSETHKGSLQEEGVSVWEDEAEPLVRMAGGQTSLRVKRAAGLQAAGDLLGLLQRGEAGGALDSQAEASGRDVDGTAWLLDHYVICTACAGAELVDPVTDRPVTDPARERVEEGYSIYSAGALLLPTMAGRPWLLQQDRVARDLVAATRETLEPYGCAHTSGDPSRVWMSQNLWRDVLARYAEAPLNRYGLAHRYWEQQVVSNTFERSRGFADAYGNEAGAFSSRGGVVFGLLLGRVRLRIDRLAPGGQRISADPDRHAPGRWPLLPLADWKAGKIPVCVVNEDGRVTVESELDPLIIRGQETGDHGLIG